MQNNVDKILDNKNKSVEFIKSKIFDIIAVGIIIAMSALSLGAIELREISLNELFNMILECIPFYFAASMLSVNYYNKGCFLGKNSDVFKTAVETYSKHVNSLSGEKMTHLLQFCNQYNKKTLDTMRSSLLQSVAITLKMFDEGSENSKPLKAMTKKELLLLYNEETVSIIQKCKKLKVKGIYPNILLSNIVNEDNTYLGLTEKELHRNRTVSYMGSYLFSIFLMTLIGVKDVLQWGWMGAALTLFKVLYIACSAYMKYFNGYEDIVVDVTNHIYRKTDILKEYEYWYSNQNFENT